MTQCAAPRSQRQSGANIRELERGGKMYKQRADDIKDAVQATDNKLRPVPDEQ